MKCKVCKQQTYELEEGMCFKCYIISHAIRIEPETPRLIGVQKAGTEIKRKLFNLLPSIFDITMDNDESKSHV